MPRSARAGIFALCLLPFAWALYGALSGTLGPDPAESLMHSTGEWSLRLLALTLLASPLRSWMGWTALLRLRRMLGLYAFFYGIIHLLTFLQFYTGWSATTLAAELVERPYITVGFLAWLAMLPLAVTSTRGMQRRLGRHWRRLHRLVYGSAVLACLHLLWQARSDVGEALAYILVFSVLLGWRMRRYIAQRAA